MQGFAALQFFTKNVQWAASTELVGAYKVQHSHSTFGLIGASFF
jgi:hypothetical protein